MEPLADDLRLTSPGNSGELPADLGSPGASSISSEGTERVESNFVQRLEGRTLLSATVARDVQAFDFSGPADVVEGVEIIDMHFTGTDAITTVTNDQQIHTLVQEQTLGTGTGLVTGDQYTLTGSAVVVDNASQTGRAT